MKFRNCAKQEQDKLSLKLQNSIIIKVQLNVLQVQGSSFICNFFLQFCCAIVLFYVNFTICITSTLNSMIVTNIMLYAIWNTHCPVWWTEVVLFYYSFMKRAP